MGVHEGRGSMKRWDVSDMMAIGRKLFAKIHKQKHHANPNHDVHFMASITRRLAGTRH